MTQRISEGQYVHLTAGTTVVLDWGRELPPAERYTRHVAGSGDGEAEALAGLPWLVTMVGLNHHTMNGGGRDYTLLDEASGLTARVRTTFQRPEGATFAATRRPR